MTKSVAALEPLADLTVHINNDGFEPRLAFASTGGERVDEQTWKGIAALFLQAPEAGFRLLRRLMLLMMMTGLACFLPLLGGLAAEFQRKARVPFLN